MAISRHDLRLPAGAHVVAARLVVDVARVPARPTVACCFPGGGMSARYFELAGSYDMAAHLARRGLVVLLVDHPGVGGSSVPADPWTLTPDEVAAADATAVAGALELLRRGGVEGVPGLPDLRAVGLGHSMGSMLVVLQQAAQRPYEGLALLGYSGRGLPEALYDAEAAVAGDRAAIRRELAALARARMGSSRPAGTTALSVGLVGDDTPTDARAALREASDVMLPLCGLFSMLPGSHAAELAAVDVPVLLGLAEHDIAGEPADEPGYLASSPDVRLHVLPGAFHNANLAARRAGLWDAIADWIEDLP